MALGVILEVRGAIQQAQGATKGGAGASGRSQPHSASIFSSRWKFPSRGRGAQPDWRPLPGLNSNNRPSDLPRQASPTCNPCVGSSPNFVRNLVLRCLPGTLNIAFFLSAVSMYRSGIFRGKRSSTECCLLGNWTPLLTTDYPGRQQR